MCIMFLSFPISGGSVPDNLFKWMCLCFMPNHKPQQARAHTHVGQLFQFPDRRRQWARQPVTVQVPARDSDHTITRKSLSTHNTFKSFNRPIADGILPFKRLSVRSLHACASGVTHVQLISINHINFYLSYQYHWHGQECERR